jgi:hypothetical protein
MCYRLTFLCRVLLTVDDTRKMTHPVVTPRLQRSWSQLYFTGSESKQLVAMKRLIKGKFLIYVTIEVTCSSNWINLKLITCSKSSRKIQVYLNVVSYLSKCDRSGCMSFHQERSRCIYGCCDGETWCFWQLSL